MRQFLQLFGCAAPGAPPAGAGLAGAAHFKLQRRRAGYPLWHGRRPARPIAGDDRRNTADHPAAGGTAWPKRDGPGAYHRPGYRHHHGHAGSGPQRHAGNPGRQKPAAGRTACCSGPLHQRCALGQRPGYCPAAAAAELLLCALRPGRQLQKALQPQK